MFSQLLCQWWRGESGKNNLGMGGGGFGAQSYSFTISDQSIFLSVSTITHIHQIIEEIIKNFKCTANIELGARRSWVAILEKWGKGGGEQYSPLAVTSYPRLSTTTISEINTVHLYIRFVRNLHMWQGIRWHPQCSLPGTEILHLSRNAEKSFTYTAQCLAYILLFSMCHNGKVLFSWCIRVHFLFCLASRI